VSYAPRGLHFEDFTAGRAFTTAARTVSEGTVDQGPAGVMAPACSKPRSGNARVG
jgi:hypothetical protein